MSTYVIGDIQGCLEPLLRLLDECGFNPLKDRLWFVGDLVNRGPDSLGVLRLVRDLGDRAVTVLGNHDLHLLVAAGGFSALHRGDTFQDVLQASDRLELLEWLCELHVEAHRLGTPRVLSAAELADAERAFEDYRKRLRPGR